MSCDYQVMWLGGGGLTWKLVASSAPSKMKENRTLCLCPECVGVYPLVNQENLYTHSPFFSLEESGVRSSPPITRFLFIVCVNYNLCFTLQSLSVYMGYRTSVEGVSGKWLFKCSLCCSI